VPHREIVTSAAMFREVVPIGDADIVAKIVTTHRLAYFRDAVLARSIDLDDATVRIINTFIFFNHNAIVRHIATDEHYLPALMAKAREGSDASDDALLDVLRLIRECVGLKNVQLSVRALGFQALLDHGVLGILPAALLHTDPRVRAAATDILSQLITFDAQAVRSHILGEAKAMAEKEGMLLVVMVTRVVTDTEAVLKSEVTENLAALLDTDAMDNTTV
jgi:hypothetical protein